MKSLVRPFAILVASFFFASFVLVAFPNGQADAAKSFVPGNIISDNNFYTSHDTMSASEIQKFLESKETKCSDRPYAPCLKNYSQTTFSRSADRYCPQPYVGAANEKASTIIYKVAAACHVSAKVLLTTLEKEQSLVTSNVHGSSGYRTAMGYGCPDHRACESRYYGFANQVYLAAHQFQRYRVNPSSYNFRAGATSYIQYNPSKSCGGSHVKIDNAATAALYNYTPYQPGGSGRCASYGNGNFFKIYTSWFGDPSAQVAPPVSHTTKKVVVNTAAKTGTEEKTAKDAQNGKGGAPLPVKTVPTTALTINLLDKDKKPITSTHKVDASALVTIVVKGLDKSDTPVVSVGHEIRNAHEVSTSSDGTRTYTIVAPSKGGTYPVEVSSSKDSGNGSQMGTSPQSKAPASPSSSSSPSAPSSSSSPAQAGQPQPTHSSPSQATSSVQPSASSHPTESATSQAVAPSSQPTSVASKSPQNRRLGTATLYVNDPVSHQVAIEHVKAVAQGKTQGVDVVEGANIPAQARVDAVISGLTKSYEPKVMLIRADGKERSIVQFIDKLPAVSDQGTIPLSFTAPRLNGHYILFVDDEKLDLHSTNKTTTHSAHDSLERANRVEKVSSEKNTSATSKTSKEAPSSPTTQKVDITKVALFHFRISDGIASLPTTTLMQVNAPRAARAAKTQPLIECRDKDGHVTKKVSDKQQCPKAVVESSKNLIPTVDKVVDSQGHVYNFSANPAIPAGTQLTVSLSGLKPQAQPYVVLHSKPWTIPTLAANTQGKLDVTFTVPASGRHTFMAGSDRGFGSLAPLFYFSVTPHGSVNPASYAATRTYTPAGQSLNPQVKTLAKTGQETAPLIALTIILIGSGLAAISYTRQRQPISVN